MKKFFLLLFVGLFGWIQAQTQQLAFPGAEGFGRYTLGARAVSNPEIYHVTNLNDAGAGSLRDAVSRPGRIVVFDVSGVIRLNSRIVFSANSYIAGQTAPGDGVVVYGDGVSFSGCNNLIVRYMRFYMGKGGSDGKDAATIANGSNMIFDHCSVLWGRDEVFSINWDNKGTEPANITFQHCLIGQGLQTHSCGGLIQTTGGTSIIGCLYIHNETRNPKVKGLNQFINNVVYNWGGSNGYILADSDGPSWGWMEGNYFISGPGSGSLPFTRARANFQLYAKNNFVDGNKNGILDGADAPVSAYGNTNAGSPPTMVESVTGFAGSNCSTCSNIPKPFLPMIEPVLSSEDALARVIASVGASLPARTEIDQYLIDDLQTYGTGSKHISNENQNGIYNNVGIVNNGEKAEVSTGGTTVAANGYLEIENYINSIDAPVGKPYVRCAISLKMNSRTTSSITLSWKNNQPDADNIEIQRSTNGTAYAAVATLSGAAASYQVTGLDEETFYTFRLVTKKGALSSTSGTLRVSTEGTPGTPLTCTDPVPANGGTSRFYTSVDFSWTNETGNWSQPVSFDVFFGETAEALTKISGNQSINDVSFGYTPSTPLVMQKTYYWRVDAINMYGTTTGEVWSFTTSTYSFTSTYLDVGQDFTGSTSYQTAQSGVQITGTGAHQVTVGDDRVTFTPSSGITRNNDNGGYRTSPNTSYWRMPDDNQYINVAPSNEVSTEKTIAKVTINGTDAQPDGSARSSPTLVFSDKIPFDPNRILEYEQIELGICRTAGLAKTVTAPVGAKSFRLYNTVRLTEIGGDDTKYVIDANGDINLRAGGQVRLAYVGVLLESITNDNPDASDVNTINELWVNGVKANIDHQTGEIHCDLTGPAGSFAVNFTLDHPEAVATLGSGVIHDFTQGSLTITVKAENGNQKVYTVSVTIVDDNTINTLKVNGISAAINHETGVILLNLQKASEYIVTYTLNSDGASANFINGSAHNFEDGILEIKVTAINGDVKTYTVIARLSDDPIKKLLLVVRDMSQNDVYDAKLLSAFTDFDVTYRVAPSVAPADINAWYDGFDLIVLHSDVDGQNATAMATRNMVGVKPILSLKAYFYNSGRWSWGTPNNSAGSGQPGASTVSVPTKYHNHQIFEGVTFNGDNLTYYAEQPVAPNSIQFLTELDGSNFNTALQAANHNLAYFEPNSNLNQRIQMHEIDLKHEAKYLMIGLSCEPFATDVTNSSYLKFNENTIRLLKNAVRYLTDPSAYYDYITNQPFGERSTDNSIFTLSVGGYPAELDNETGTATVVIPDVIGSYPVVYVLNDSKAQASFTSGDMHNFTEGPLGFTVTAENGDTKEFTVTAHFDIVEPDHYVITLNSTGGTLPEGVSNIIEVIQGEPVGTLPVPLKIGYTFAGWNTAFDGSGEFFTETTIYNIAGDINLYAQWTAITGIHELDRDNLKVYPNPATDVIFIRGLEGGELISVFDISGRCVFTSKASDTQVDIAVNDLSPGTYLVKVVNNHIEKIIKIVLN